MGASTSATSASAADVPFFFKQWGGVQKKRRARTGRADWDEMPELVTL